MDGMGEVNTPWRGALHRLRRAEIGSWLEVAIAMAQVVERKHGTDFAAKTVLDDAQGLLAGRSRGDARRRVQGDDLWTPTMPRPLEHSVKMDRRAPRRRVTPV
jgi:hypothetical protein